MTDDVLIPAATVLLVRDGGEGLEVLMLRRNSKIAFGGMWVFPGGAVEDDDRLHDAESSARLAAVRETEEESGLRVSAEAMETWSFWEPPPRAAMSPQGATKIRRFATWFFVVPAPEGDVAIDGGEIHEHRWLQPGHAMDLRRAGEIEIVPPTWVTLLQLSRHDSVDNALTWARTTTSREFRTRPIGKDPLTLAWSGDVAYEGGPADATGPRHRLTMLPDDWHYEDTAP
ncbi:MAG: NUDIX hydrolase [Actinomycetota bacterium]